jgi:recombination protein RecT
MSVDINPVALKKSLGDWFSKNLAALGQLWNPSDAKRMYLCAMNAISRNPDLLKCSKQSLTMGMIQCAEMRLFPGVLGEAALVPYWNKKTGSLEAQFMPQYQGLCKLAYQSGLVTRIVADVVYTNDEFDYCQGSDTFLRHKKALKNRGERVCVYCLVKMKDGGEKFEILPMEEVYTQHRARSKSFTGKYPESSPWVTDEDEMSKKTAIRMTLKTIPKSYELARAMEEANDSQEPAVPDFDGEINGVVVRPIEEDNKVEAMKDKVQRQAAEKPEAAPKVEAAPAPEAQAETDRYGEPPLAEVPQQGTIPVGPEVNKPTAEEQLEELKRKNAARKAAQQKEAK